MEFLNTLTAWQWGILLAVPPAIVALYFLKLRRQPVEVPSTYLWHKSIEDLHVNSLWQRIRQSLLLYLQLLVVCLVMVALLRPGWRSGQLSGDRHIFLIDNSASMNATDVAPSRWEEAKRQALALVDEMASGDKGMVISFSDTARVEQGFTDNRRELRRAVENIRPTNRPTLLDEALRAAAGLANPGRTAEYGEEKVIEAQRAQLFIFSDGKFPPVQGFSLGSLEPVFVPIGSPDAANVGITAFAVRRNEEREGRLQAFGSVTNFGDEEVTTTVELAQNGNPIDATKVKIPAGQSTGVTFDLGEVESGTLEARLVGSDELIQDNRVWAAVNSSRRPKVLLVTPGNEALEFALSTERAAELADITKAKPEVLKTKEYRQAAAGGAYDLIIYDRCGPAELPQASTLFIAAAPPAAQADVAVASRQPDSERGSDAPDQTSEVLAGPSGAKSWSLGDKVVYPQVIDVDRTHPLMQWVDLGDVDIAEARPVSPPAGGTRLLDSNKGTLLAIAPREGFEDAVLGFEIYGVDATGQKYANTNWPIRRSFPSFVFAVLGYLGGNDGGQAGESTKPGQPVVLKSNAPVDSLGVRTPRGATLVAPRGKSGMFQFSATDELGPYEVRAGDTVEQRFTVNLFDSLESDIRPAKENSIQIGYVAVEGSTGFEPVRRETWKWLLAAGLVVLLVEWYIYNRRVYI